MSLKDQNIEELFRSGLEDAEMPVNDAMWSNISAGIGKSAATAAGASTAKVLTYLGLAGAACTVGVAATLFFTNTTESSNGETAVNNPTFEEKAKEQITPITSKTAEITEDKKIINQIILKEDIQNDPIITKEEKIKESKKVVTVTEAEKHMYKGSWLNGFLTPKPSPNTTNTATTTTIDNTNSNVKPEIKKDDKVTPSISETEENEIIASILAMPVGGYAPLEVSFAHHSESGTARWDFGDGTISLDNATTHTFEKYGKYTVTLSLTGADGKEYKDYRVIEVLASSALTKIPNVFTPNNDGANDYFLVEGKNIASFSLAILTTKGEIIYQSSRIEDQWDGKDKFGDPVPIDTYVVIISAKGIDGKKYEHSGTVTLKR